MFKYHSDSLHEFKEMYISNTHYRLSPITKDNLPAVATLLTEQFLGQNSIWSSAEKEEVREFMMAKTLEMLEWEEELRNEGWLTKDGFINITYLDSNGDVVAVWTLFELTQYLRKKSKVSLPFFSQLEGQNASLQQSIHKKDIIPGLNISGMFFAVKKELIGTKASGLFVIDSGHWLHQQGFRNVFGRVSNKKALLGILKYGGEVIAENKVKFRGKDECFWYVKMPMVPLAVKQHMLTPFRAYL